MLDQVLRQVAARGRTVVMTSHDLARVTELASRFDVLSRGQIRASIRREALTQDGLLAFFRQALAEPAAPPAPAVPGSPTMKAPVPEVNEVSAPPAPAREASQDARPAFGTPFLRAMLAVLWKDLAAEWRSRELLTAMLVFALLVILIFNFALELDPAARANITSGVLWVTFTFAGTIGLNRSMAVEKDRGCLDGLLLAPVDRSAIYFGKTLGNLIFMLLMAAIILSPLQPAL